jgi:type III secretion protein O
MFKKITKIKEIKHLNARLKEAKLNARYQQAMKDYEQSKVDVKEFHDYRLKKEDTLVSQVLGELVTLVDIDLMNEKVSGLRGSETDLKMNVRKQKKAQDSAYDQWQIGVRTLIQAQKAIDKFEYITELERHTESIKIQYLEDLELEEFKPIKTLEYAAI